ncbi:MAG: hypothetical protein NT151_12025 [Acidobacteria bacterium]|nr:hypothetical protein [Acidobacteriota bacterium]
MAIERRIFARIAPAIAAAFLGSVVVVAQNPLQRLLQIPALDKILSTPAALTSGVANAYPDAPILDDETEETAAPMTSLPRDADGAFTLSAGVFEFHAKSFCLQTGAPGASRGEGYLYAPLAGPKARIVGDILTRLYRFPDISQEDAQSLLWAILSHAKFSTLPRDLQAVAARLLPPADIAALEASAADRIWEAVREQAEARLPPAVFAILDAQARLRDLLATGASYSEMASIAVPDGTAEPQEGDREIPVGRWNYDPSGFFIRFMASSYTDTTMQVMVPEVYTIERDKLHRITALRSPDGWTTEAAYDDAIAPLIVPGDPGLKGYTFKRLTYKQPVKGRIETFQLEDQGWTFAGRSNGRGRVPDGAPSLTPMLHGPAVGDADPGDRYADWGQRYKDGQKWAKKTAPPSEKDVDDLTDTKHYVDGARKAVTGSAKDKVEWLAEHGNRERRTTAYVLCRLEGGCDPDEKTPKPPRKVNPGGRVAAPGAKGEQLLGSSGVGR